MSMKAKSDATHYNLPKPKIVKDGPQPGPSDLEKKAAKADAKVKKYDDGLSANEKDEGLTTESKELVAEAKHEAQKLELETKKEKII